MKNISKIKILSLSAVVLLVVSILSWRLAKPSSEMNARTELTKLGYEFNSEGVAKAMFAKDNLAVQHFIDAKIDPNIEQNSLPLLKLALISNNEKMFNYALNGGADVNSNLSLIHI